MKKSHLIYSLTFLISLYALSFGPALYLATKLSTSRVPNEKAVEIASMSFVYAYYPHLVLMGKSESYYRYGYWWAEVGGDQSKVPYPEFAAFIRTALD
jgi:hypothetical protein